MKTLGPLGTLLLVILIVGGNVSAANTGIVKIDRISCQFSADTLLTGGNPRILLRFINNTGHKVSISNGFEIFTPDGATIYNVVIDTVFNASTHRSVFADYFDLFFLFPGSPESPYIDTVGATGYALAGTTSGLPIGYNDTALAITLYCPTDQATNDHKHVCIDSSRYDLSTTWKWSYDQTEVVPEFQGLFVGQPYRQDLGGGYCFMFYDLPCFTIDGQASPNCGKCGSCCVGTTGNVNMIGIIDLADLSTLIAYLTATVKPTLPCPAAANVNAAGIIDLVDLSMLIAYLTVSPRPTLPLCP